MRRGHPLPRIWLMTDARVGDVTAAVSALPRRSGIVFRHHHLPKGERRALFRTVLSQARRNGHVVILADRPQVARLWRADGSHDRSLRPSAGLRTVPVHSVKELILARRVGADLIFVSPVFETRSHPGARTLGRARAGMIAGNWRDRAIALGGMDRARAKSLRVLGFYGWAGIDAFRT